jgi:hypothetical protein
MLCAARIIAVGFAAVLLVQDAAYGQRAFVAEFHAWDSPITLMAAGKVVRASYPRWSMQAQSPDRNAYYDLEISEWLKPRDAGLPPRITIVAPWGATDTAVFRVGTEVLIFVQRAGDYYHSVREIELDTPAGQQTLRGVRLFVGIMYLPDLAQRQKACLDAWNVKLSNPEMQSVLSAMWETRTPDYSRILRKVALGNDSPGVRGWALTILASIGNREGVEELVPILLSDADCEVKRQLLIVLGAYRVQLAVAAIDEFLAADLAGRCSSWRADDLRTKAREARGKITGIDVRSGWK